MSIADPSVARSPARAVTVERNVELRLAHWHFGPAVYYVGPDPHTVTTLPVTAIHPCAAVVAATRQ
jgi:hypothetical protein